MTKWIQCAQIAPSQLRFSLHSFNLKFSTFSSLVFRVLFRGLTSEASEVWSERSFKHPNLQVGISRARILFWFAAETGLPWYLRVVKKILSHGFGANYREIPGWLEFIWIPSSRLRSHQFIAIKGCAFHLSSHVHVELIKSLLHSLQFFPPLRHVVRSLETWNVARSSL
jgi:hypothetical protein